MSKNVNTGRGGKSRVVGPINKSSNKSDATSGKSVSNTHKRAGKVDEKLNKFLRVSDPVFSPGSGPTSTDFDVTLTNQEAGATYKYTIDDTSPTGTNALTWQTTTVGLSLTGTANPSLTLKSYGLRNDYADSDIVVVNYTLQRVADPVFDLPTGNVPENQLISLNIQPGATGYYTLDGTVPSGGANTLSSQYTLPFVLNFAGNTVVTGKAISVKNDAIDSHIVTGTFTHDSSLDYGGPYDGIRDVDGKLPTFSPTGNTLPYPSKIFLSTTMGQPIERGISFWGTDALVENNKPIIKNDFISIKAGQNHALALTQSGTVVAWGDNSDGQITLSNSLLTSSGEITRIDAGDSHSLALTTEDDVIAWGNNAQGQTNVPSNLKAIRIAAGGEHSLALQPDRTIVGWGENSDGQINLPTNLNDVIDISAGENHSAALIGYGVKTCKQLELSDGHWNVIDKPMPIGRAAAWGLDDLNQSTVPETLGEGSPQLIKISCGGNFSLALDAQGKVFGWGDAGHNQVPPAEGMSLYEPDGSLAYIVDIDAGFSHGVALSDKGSVLTWGSNQNNQLDVTNLLSNSSRIAGGDNYSLAYGQEPKEHIYYNTGVLDPSILYTGAIDVTEDTTFNIISQDKSSQASSNLISKTYTQQKLNAADEVGLLSSRGTYTPIEDGTVNPARFTPTKDFAVKIHEDDVQKEPDVEITVSHPGHLSYQIEDTSITDATEKRFSSTLVDGDVDKAFDGDKSIDNYLSFNPGGYVGYKFDAEKRVTKADFATNADNFHKVGDGLIQGSNDGMIWEDVAFFSKRFPDSYPPFLSLDGLPLDRIASIEMIGGGAGYTEDPVIVFQVAEGEEGEDAKAKALFSPFALADTKVLEGGTGYTSVPSVTFNSIHDGAGAAGTAVLTTDAIVHGIVIEGDPTLSSGNGYTSAPTVSIVGGGGQNATAIAHLAPTELTGIEIIKNKVPYRTSPTVGFQGGGGQGAEAVAHLTAFTIGGINGSGLLISPVDYMPPYGFHVYDGVGVLGVGAPTRNSFSDDPTGVYKLDHFDLDEIGEGYTSAPDVSLEGGTITQPNRPYAIKFSDGHRGPTSGQFVKSAKEQGFTESSVGWERTRDLDEMLNHNYHSGYFYKNIDDVTWYTEGDGLHTVPQYFDINFDNRLFSGWDAELSNRMLFDFHNYQAHMEALPYNANTPFDGLYEGGIPAYNDREPGNLFYTSSSQDSRPYRLKFHKDSALRQKIDITGGGGAGLTGYVELRNHNELLGFDDSDTLLDKLICLYTHPDYLNNNANVSAHDVCNITYEELLWSTPVSKGGLLPDEDANLIPYKLHITGMGDGYTSAPTITEEFDRSFPGMMYYLEPTGLTIETGEAVNYDTIQHAGDHHLVDPEDAGWVRLWGSGNAADGYTAPQGTCATSLTGVAYSDGGSWPDYISSSGFALENKYLSSSTQFKLPFMTYNPAKCNHCHHPYIEIGRVQDITITNAGSNPPQSQGVWEQISWPNVLAEKDMYVHEEPVWFKGVNVDPGYTGVGEVLTGIVGDSSNGWHVGITGIRVNDGGLGYDRPEASEIELVYGPPGVNNHAGFRADNAEPLGAPNDYGSDGGYEILANQTDLKFDVGAGLATRVGGPERVSFKDQNVRLRRLKHANGSNPEDDNRMYGTVDRYHNVDQVAVAQVSTVQILGEANCAYNIVLNTTLTGGGHAHQATWSSSDNNTAVTLRNVINASALVDVTATVGPNNDGTGNIITITHDTPGLVFWISASVSNCSNNNGSAFVMTPQPAIPFEAAGTLIVDIGSTIEQATGGWGGEYKATSSTEWGTDWAFTDFVLSDDGNSVGSSAQSPALSYGDYCTWAVVVGGFLSNGAAMNGNYDGQNNAFRRKYEYLGGNCGNANGYGYSNTDLSTITEGLVCEINAGESYLPQDVFAEVTDASAGKFSMRTTTYGQTFSVSYGPHQHYAYSHTHNHSLAQTTRTHGEIVLDSPSNLDSEFYSAGKHFYLRAVGHTGYVYCDILSFDSNSGLLKFNYSTLVGSSSGLTGAWWTGGWEITPAVDNWTIEVAYGDPPYGSSSSPDTISYEPDGSWWEGITYTMTLGSYDGKHQERPWEQIEFYAPKLVAEKMHVNDMYSATSAERVNFENQLAEWIDFTALMPDHSDVEAFLASGYLESVEVTNIGDGYTSVPDVQFAGGTTDVEATGLALISKGIDSVNLTNVGADYRAFPDIIIENDGGGADAQVIGTKAASDITGLLLVDGGKNYTESPTMIVQGGGVGVTGPAEVKCRLPVALGTLAFTNNKHYKEYRMIGQGDNALKTSQVNEVDFYSGDYRISNYSNRNDHSLAIKSDTSLLGWGDDTYGQLPSAGITNAISISAGSKHSLIAKENGTVVAFGDNTHGQINVPDDLTNVINVSAGDHHSVALLAGGMVRSWGSNVSGQCDTPSSLQNGTTDEHGAIAVKASSDHTLALIGDGTVMGWGATIPATIPQDLTRVNSVAAGRHFSLALKDNGDVIGWGDGYGSQIPQDLKDVVAIDACNDHVLALQVDGSVTGWGKIHDGQNSVDIADVIPQELNSGINIFAGKNHGSILRDDGSMISFGYICTDEVYNDGVMPPNPAKTYCCGETGSIIFDLGQTNSDELNTSEKISYRSKNIADRLTSDTYFPPDNSNLQNKAKVVVDISKAGYADADSVTVEYPLVKLSPEVFPETNTSYGPSITIPNWDQDSVGDLDVFYTLDGTDPAVGNGTIFEVNLEPNDGDFIYAIPAASFTNSTTLKVFATSDVYLNSDIVSYTRQQLSAPTVNITEDGNTLTIAMSATVPAGETRTPVIYYTLDGTTPDATDYNYTSPVSLQGTTATVKAIAFLVGYIDSNVTTETYP